MNISLQNVDKVSAILTVEFEKADYQARYEKSLKAFRQKANMPGFRKGMVPMGLIQKQFGPSILAEEVDKLMQEKVYEYLKDNNIEMLGSPLPKENNADFRTGENFTFTFDVALAPQFEVSLTKEDTIDYYDIEVSDEIVDQQVKMYAQRNASYEKVEEYKDNDMLKGLMAELDENGNPAEGGLRVEGAVMMPSYMKDEAQKAIFNEAKVNSVLVFNPSVAYNNDAELASLLKIKKEDVASHKGNFSFQIEEITRAIPGELNQELFDTVLGKDKAHNEEEFRAAIKATIAQQFVADSDYKLLIDARAYITNKVGKLEFPEALLKRIMLLNNEEKGEEFVSENYDKSIEELTWHLIKEKLVKAFDVKVDDKDIMEMAKETTRAQFIQYGMLNVDDELLDNYAREMVKKRESVEALVNRVIEAKLAAAIKEQVTLNHKAVSMEEFNKMFQ